MSVEETLITCLVLVGIFFLGYSAIRNQGIRETINEITGNSKDKIQEVVGGIPYKNV